jgi:hypothetical protein
MHDPLTRLRTLRQAMILGAAAAIATAAGASETITYTYDARGRVKQVSRSGTPAVNNGVATSYGYDKADNRTNKTTIGSANPPPP